MLIGRVSRYVFCVESIFSDSSGVISPSKPHPTTSNKCHDKFLEHAGNLQQLKEMDANLKLHIAQGWILHLASINPGNEDSNSCNDSSLIESASVNIPQLKVSIFSLHINPLFNHVRMFAFTAESDHASHDIHRAGPSSPTYPLSYHIHTLT